MSAAAAPDAVDVGLEEIVEAIKEYQHLAQT